MAAQIIFTGLAVILLFDAGFLSGLAWAARSPEGHVDRRTLASIGVALSASLICAIAGGVA